MRETNAFGSGVGTRSPFPAGADAGRSLREERCEKGRLENVDAGRRLRIVRGPLPIDVPHVPSAHLLARASRQLHTAAMHDNMSSLLTQRYTTQGRSRHRESNSGGKFAANGKASRSKYRKRSVCPRFPSPLPLHKTKDAAPEKSEASICAVQKGAPPATLHKAKDVHPQS
jgi:hypothetical protein